MVEQVNPSKTGPPGIIVCVGGVVLKEERILFVRQAQGHPLEKQWTIPWGLVDPGETPEDAVLREIEEEAGIKAEIDGLLGIQNLPDPWDGWIGIIFKCQPVSGSPRSDGGTETDRAGFYSLEELAALEEEIEPWCEWLAERMLSQEPQLISPESSNPYAPKLAFL